MNSKDPARLRAKAFKKLAAERAMISSPAMRISPSLLRAPKASKSKPPEIDTEDIPFDPLYMLNPDTAGDA
jgi:hypothetical protein